MTVARKTLVREPLTAAGEILLSHNHIALLHGLYDRPDGYVASRSEWVRATRPFIERMKGDWNVWGLRGAMIRINPAWVSQKRKGRFITAELTERGRAIVERRIPARIRGRGAYDGLHSIDAAAVASRKACIPDVDIREAVRYARIYGLPLLMRSVDRRNGKVFAVSSGLDQPFTLVSPEELQSRCPRRLHWEWTQEMIDSGKIPQSYLHHFAGYDEEDIVEYLREQPPMDVDSDLYVQIHAGKQILSQGAFERFLDEEIDISLTDFDCDDFPKYARGRSASYDRALQAIPARLSWMNPDTGRVVGSIYIRKSSPELPEIVVTGPAALSCLQRHWDNCDVGLHIETRYK